MMKILKNYWFGSILTFIISSILLIYFYGNLLKTPNKVFFANSGDGLQSYYNSLYHIKYDSVYFRVNGLNYPFGEHVFYSNNQPLISNFIKRICQIIDISDHTIGIINILILMSIIISCLVIYLILKELKLPPIYSSIIAIGISFLSPQINRFGGHFCLAYVFVIPLLIYGLMKLYYKPRFITSILIGLFAFWLATTHLYFVGIFGILLLFYWLYFGIEEKERFGGIYKIGIHIFLQILLPLIIFQVIATLNDTVNDRTHNPWGFLFYRAYPESIFLPIGKPYAKFLFKLSNFRYIDWEGYAYVGLIASIGFFIVFGKVIRNLIKKRFNESFNITDNNLLNIFFWASFAGLLYSWGIPFVLGLEGLVDYIGPLKQMRGIARFSWIFYYVINIVCFYMLYKRVSKFKFCSFKYILLYISVLFLVYDAYLYVRHKEKKLNNTVAELTDAKNELPVNKFLNNLEKEKYQAIIPIPYFHTGSESIWLGSKCGLMKQTFITSLKTGLPTTGVLLSRTSLSQTYMNIQAMTEPYRDLLILDKFPNNKLFLILAGNCDELNGSEKKILEHSNQLYEDEKYIINELPYTYFENIVDSLYYYVRNEIETSRLFLTNDDFLIADTLAPFIYKSFDEISSQKQYFGKGAFPGKGKSKNIILNDTLNWNQDYPEYIVSFWFSDYQEDLYARSQFRLEQYNSNNERIETYKIQLFNRFIVYDYDWVLFEDRIRINPDCKEIIISIKNKELKNKLIYIDELLFRPLETNIYKITDKFVMKNNRFYFINQSF